MPTGLTKDAGWQIGVSRTLDQPLETVWEFIASRRGLALWLGPGAVLTPEKGAPYEADDGTAGEVRGYRPGDRIRLTWRPPGWDHDTTVQVAVTASGRDKAVLRFHQERMASAEERERQRAHWTAVMDEVAAALGA